MNQFFIKLLNMSFAAGVLVPVVILLRLVLKRAPKWTRCLLWAFVALRLLLPVEIASPLSLFNALGRQENGSVEYFYAAGGSEKPLVSFDTFRFDGSADPEDRVINFPDGAPLVRHEATRYLPPLVTAWLIGVGLMLLYLLWSYVRLRRRVSASVPLEDRVWICDCIDAPFILGLFRPRIYIPSTLAEPQRSYVLAHERAHLTRRDHWWKPLGFTLLAVHWFNPLLWLAYFLLCRDIELACDEKVFKSMDPESRTDYSQALLDLSRPRAIAACPLAFGETGVKARIKAALNYKKPAFWLILAAIVLCAVAAVSFLTNPSYSTNVLPEEQQILREMMIDYGLGAENLRTDVLYNRRGNPWCLIAVSDDSYLIVRRRGYKFMECVENSSDPNPYKGYWNVPKFYFGPIFHYIRGGDAEPECQVSDDRFYNLTRAQPAGRIGYRARRVPYPQATSGPVLQVRSGGEWVGTYEILRMSREDNDDVFAGESKIEDVIRENADVIPVLTWGGAPEMLTWDNAEFPEDGLRIYDAETMERLVLLEDDWLSALGPGRYWWCQEVRLRGAYLPEAERYDKISYVCVFCLEIPDGASAESAEPLLTAHSGSRSVNAFPITRWSEHGDLSADGVPLESAIPDSAMDIPTLMFSGTVSLTARPDVEVLEGQMLVFDEALNPVIREKDEVWLEGIQRLDPGTYYCAVAVERHFDGGAACDDCVFRLVVPDPSTDDDGIPADIRALLGAIPDADPEIPTAYVEALAEHGIVVTDPEWHIYNKALWDAFYSDVQNGTPADVVLALFENERDVLIYYLRFDGEQILMVRDSRRHSFFGEPDLFSEVYGYVQTLSRADVQMVVLSDEPYADYQEYMASIQQTPETAPLLVMAWNAVATRRPGDPLPVTKLALLKFVDIGISNRSDILNIQENRPEGESDKQLIETLKQEIRDLQAFREEVEKDVTDQNVMDYWNRCWNDILKASMPLGYDSSAAGRE